jgi:hypothetical protein
VIRSKDTKNNFEVPSFSYKDVPVYASFDAQNHCEVSAKHASMCIHTHFNFELDFVAVRTKLSKLISYNQSGS